MRKKRPEPDNPIELMAIFFERYGDTVNAYAHHLDELEREAAAKRAEDPDCYKGLPEGHYSRQAGYLHAVTGLFHQALASREAPPRGPDTDEVFSRAIAALNFMIDERDQASRFFKRRGNPERLERAYRKSQGMDEFAELSEDDTQRIERKRRSYAGSRREVECEKEELTCMVSGLKEIRAAVNGVSWNPEASKRDGRFPD